VNSADIVSALIQVFPQALPEAILGVAACVLFLGSTVWANRQLWAAVALLALAAAGVALWVTTDRVPTIEQRQADLVRRATEISDLPAGAERAAAERQQQADEKALTALRFTGPILPTRLALFIRVIALVAGAVLVLFSWNEVPDRLAGEYHGCLLITIAGLGLTGAANELVTLFLALELISIPTYILLYLPRSDPASQEAAVKYFLLSIFSSALLLFGFSYLYGLTGTTNITGLLDVLGGVPRDVRDPSALPGVSLVALVMIVAGLSYKITAVPFHFYAPDVYQGAPTAAVAQLAFVPKLAGFVALLRVLGFLGKLTPGQLVAPGLELSTQVPILLWILAAMTMTLGNVLALLQNNLKRLLAYSSVAHAGYMLIGLAVAPELSLAKEQVLGGTEAVLFYMVAYGAMTVGAFAVLSYLSTPQRPVETVDDLAGLSSTHPGVALVMAIFLFSLIGIPLTAGFAGKFLIFFGAMAVPTPERAALFRWLALIGVINAAIGAWYYLRIVAAMYLRDTIRPLDRPRTWPGLAALWICAALTIALGVYPWPMVEVAQAATHMLR
jgi:NADH-quinone oxidoreductase subunit N